MSHRKWRLDLCVLAIFSLCATSALAAAPTISGFSPGSGVLYSAVTISGTNFVTPVTVSFNGVASTSVTVVSSTSVKATVPPTAPTGLITVAAAGGSVNSASAFTVLPGALASPAVGPPTTVTRLYYSGFSAYEPVDFYFDTGDIAISSASASGAGNPLVTIPASGRPGSHWVTAVGRRSLNSAQVNFTVQTSWPQLGFAPNHKGKNRYENVLSTATAGDLDEAWRTANISQVMSTPAVVNGIVYATFGDGSIRAFDEITGAQKWSYPTTAPYSMYSSPAVANGIVYVGSGDYNLYALDAVTGKLKWQYPTGNVVYSSPTVVNGLVYFGSYDDNVYALNATTGALVWSFATGGYIYSSPLIVNGLGFVGSSDGSVYCFDAVSGQKLRGLPTGGIVIASPVIAGGLVCFGSEDGYFYAFDATYGNPVWSLGVLANIDSSAAVSGGAIFFADQMGYVRSLSTGGVFRWATRLPSQGECYSPLCVANGVVYVRDNHYTYALDQNSGALLTTMPVASVYGGVAVVNGAVFAGDVSDGVLTRYTPNGLLSNFVAPRPEPMQLRPHPPR